MPAPFFFMLQHDSFYASAIAGNLNWEFNKLDIRGPE